VKHPLSPQDLPKVEIPLKAQRIMVEMLLHAVSSSEPSSTEPTRDVESELK